MKIKDEKHLLFLHVLDALALEYSRFASQSRLGVVKLIKQEFEKLFERELTEARTGKHAVDPAVLQRVLDAVAAAKKKHPEFATSAAHGVSLVAEETGELAQEINDMISADSVTRSAECLDAARYEAAHVAVTALRLLEFLK